jgi:LmbE family N-acetylglucosaminyl deacetylase
MIIPIVPEEDWLRILRPCPAWEASRSFFLVIAPHPDDETLATGGMISAMRSDRHNVVVAAVTDGENAYEDAEFLDEVRAVEQRNALEILGVSPAQIIRLGLPDRDVAAHEHALVARLMSFANSSTHIIAPWQADFHPDHEACGRAAQSVARQTGARLSFYSFDMAPRLHRSAQRREFAQASTECCLETRQSPGSHVPRFAIAPRHRRADPTREITCARQETF